ncbi:cytochrome P450 4C1-like [Schistocerca cancellata]|uniref:cytochrome P450 4C1-like n=1 Tax=Schistocerca cancellata TaxID=274614 RepID=UPI002117A83C|nr:cytochrome P450 4C1-like [Schistocerca cancellata]
MSELNISVKNSAAGRPWTPATCCREPPPSRPPEEGLCQSQVCSGHDSPRSARHSHVNFIIRGASRDQPPPQAAKRRQVTKTKSGSRPLGSTVRETLGAEMSDSMWTSNRTELRGKKRTRSAAEKCSADGSGTKDRRGSAAQENATAFDVGECGACRPRPLGHVRLAEDWPAGAARAPALPPPWPPVNGEMAHWTLQASDVTSALALLLALPGPTDTLPICGDGISLRGAPITALRRLYHKHGTPCRVWVGPRLYVLLSHPEHARLVLSTGAHVDRDDYIMEVLRPLTGNGLLASRGDLWRSRRRLLSRVYKTQWLQEQYTWLQKAAETLVSAMRPLWSDEASAAGAEEETLGHLAACTLDQVAGSVVGRSLLAGGADGVGFVKDYMRAVQTLHARVMNPFLLVTPIFKLSSLGREQVKLANSMHQFIDDSVEKMKKLPSDESESCDSGASSAGRLPGSALEALLELTQDRRLLREEIATLLLAGQDTTATAICFALQLLALHPEIQEEAAWDEALQERVVRETLRLFPPSPLLSRELTADVQLPATDDHGPLVLPAGSSAVVCALFLHRDPAVWDDPLAFRPDRFLPEACKERHPFAYLPFGGGPRSCIGSKYAQMQMRAVLSKVLPAFRVTTTATREDLEDLKMGMVITPKNGFNLRYEPRG